MKKILVLCVIINLSFCAKAQSSIFEAVESERWFHHSDSILQNKGDGWGEYFKRLDSIDHISKTFYRIVLKDIQFKDRNYESALEDSIYAKIDTLKAVEELLKFEGDERLCALYIMKYNHRMSKFWFDDNKNYSLQVEALFLINQIIFKEPFMYSHTPALEDHSAKKKSAIGGEIVSRAYKAYKEWFVVVKRQGLQKTLSEKYFPLDNSGISWY